jgi:hypothetical protein
MNPMTNKQKLKAVQSVRKILKSEWLSKRHCYDADLDCPNCRAYRLDAYLSWIEDIYSEWIKKDLCREKTTSKETSRKR